MPTKYGRSLSHEDLTNAQDSEKVSFFSLHLPFKINKI